MVTNVPNCDRCGQPLVTEGQTCKVLPQSGQRWPCIRPDDQSVFEAPVGSGSLKIKAGWGIRPVPILDDPYAIDREEPERGK